MNAGGDRGEQELSVKFLLHVDHSPSSKTRRKIIRFWAISKLLPPVCRIQPGILIVSVALTFPTVIAAKSVHSTAFFMVSVESNNFSVCDVIK